MLNKLFTITALSILLSTSLAQAEEATAKAGGMKSKAEEGCPAFASKVETQKESREVSASELNDKFAAKEEDKAKGEAETTESAAGAHKGGEEEKAE